MTTTTEAIERMGARQDETASYFAGSADYYRAKIQEWETRVRRLGNLSERFALAQLDAENADIREFISADHRQVIGERDKLLQAIQAAKYRLGERQWVAPKAAPWSGF